MRQEGCGLDTSDNRYLSYISRPVRQGLDFVRRQPTHWIVSALRSSLSILLYNIVAPYISIYTISLGASATELGIVHSAGMASAGLVAPFIGWIIDRQGVRRVYLIGIVLLAAAYVIYGVAGSWAIAALAMVVYWLGKGLSGQSCATICGNSIRNEDRATAMSLCETLASGILGMLAPLIGTALVIRCGGVEGGGIRPLFFVSLAGTVGTFFLIYRFLPNRRWSTGNPSMGFLQDLRTVFRSGTKLGRWLIIDAVGYLPMGMVIPFAQPYAHQLKGASELVLGLMITAYAVTPLVLGLPAGRIADRIGRKPVLYVTISLSWLSSVALILAPNSGVLVLSGVLLGFFMISSVTAGAMAYELVPKAHMGRWLGISSLVRMLLAATAAFAAGWMWDAIGPQYVFLTAIAADVVLRMPLLISMPETLRLAEGRDRSA